MPGLWEDVGGKDFAKLDGFAWYRAWVKVPEDWKGGDLTLSVDRVMNAFEAYWEGELVGTGGAFPPKYRDASGEVQSLTIPVTLISEPRNIQILTALPNILARETPKPAPLAFILALRLP